MGLVIDGTLVWVMRCRLIKRIQGYREEGGHVPKIRGVGAGHTKSSNYYGLNKAYQGSMMN